MINCREYALKLVAFKDRTEKEMYEKLSQKGYFEEDICAQIEFLKEYGYINDERYARMFISDCMNIKKWGNGKIRIELIKKGVNKEIIENLLTDDEDGILESEFRRRFCDADLSNIKERRRIFGYFARRGFKSSAIQGMLNKMSAFRDVYYDEEI